MKGDLRLRRPQRSGHRPPSSTEYPREARRLGKEGTVILKLSLDASGEVGTVEILRSAGFGMEEAAREARSAPLPPRDHERPPRGLPSHPAPTCLATLNPKTCGFKALCHSRQQCAVKNTDTV